MTERAAELSITWRSDTSSRGWVATMQAAGRLAKSRWYLIVAGVLFAIGSVLAVGSGLSVIPVTFSLSQIIPPALLGLRWVLCVMTTYVVLTASLLVTGFFYVKIDWSAPWIYLVVGLTTAFMVRGRAWRRWSAQGEIEGSERA